MRKAAVDALPPLFLGPAVLQQLHGGVVGRQHVSLHASALIVGHAVRHGTSALRRDGWAGGSIR